MGRRYYCEYCDKSFVETSDAVKKHRNGLLHQKLMKEHYNKFKDMQTIIDEESVKNPCNRYLKTGECGFGSNCRYSHYTGEQLDYMRWEVQQSQCVPSDEPPSLQTWFFSRRQRGLKDSPMLNKVFTDSTPLDSMTSSNVMPWDYPHLFNSLPNVPPSVTRLSLMDVEKSNFQSWG